MKDTERNIYQMGKNVRDFAAAHASSFTTGSRASTLIASLTAEVARLDALSASQASGQTSARQGTTTKGEARRALLEDLEAISDTARAMSYETAGLEDKFRFPRGRANDQQLIAFARSFLADAEPFKAEFVANELPAGFLSDLAADIDAFEQASTSQQRGRQTHVAATDGIEEATENIVSLVRQLNGPVLNKFRHDAVKLGAWTSAAHVMRPPRVGEIEVPIRPPAVLPTEITSV